jgi:chromosome segregation ATPase
MSVHKHPREWAREMDMMMGKGEINKDNYLTDCANAVVYVRESAEKIAKLEAELAAMQTLLNKALDDYGRVQGELTASREQWRTMACVDCALVASLKERHFRAQEQIEALTNTLDVVIGQRDFEMNKRIATEGERNAFIAAILGGCEDVPEHLRGITATDRLRVLRMERDALKADRDRLAQEVRDVNQRLGEAWEKLRKLKGDMNQ